MSICKRTPLLPLLLLAFLFFLYHIATHDTDTRTHARTHIQAHTRHSFLFIFIIVFFLSLCSFRLFSLIPHRAFSVPSIYFIVWGFRERMGENTKRMKSCGQIWMERKRERQREEKIANKEKITQQYREWESEKERKRMLGKKTVPDSYLDLFDSLQCVCVIHTVHVSVKTKTTMETKRRD